MSESVSGRGGRQTFTVLLGGELTVTPRLRAQVAGCRAVAADGGMAHAAVLGLNVELWVGDFDSTPAALLAAHPGVPRETHSTDKDKTDGELAIDAALARGAGELVLAGALGGQTDHMLGHLALLLALARRGIPAFATSGAEEVYPLLPGRLALDVPAGSRLSIIAFSDLDGLTIAGVRWPLTRATIGQGSTRTLSNTAEGPVSLELAAGAALVVIAPAG